MSAQWRNAAAAVAEILEAENRALAAMDLTAAAKLTPDKERLVAALVLAGPGDPTDPAVRDLARRLDGLTRENQARLERGLAAQRRVIEIVVAAARTVRRNSAGATGRYTARGAGARPAGVAVAFSARA